MQNEIFIAEKAIKERLQTEHIALHPRLEIKSGTGNIVLIEESEEYGDFTFGKFEIVLKENGFYCNGKETNIDTCLKDSKLLQNLISTVVEETLDEYLLGVKDE